MASLFVSHSSHDRSAAEWLGARLRAAGFAALFVDFDPEQGIPAGRNWERELYAQLRRTEAVIFLASAASVASQWCLLEVGLARSLGRPVFPVRLAPGVRLPLLADVQWTDLTDAEAGLARLLAGLRAAGLDPADAFAWDPRRSPYPGLASFQAEDAAVFFGRESETQRLLDLLQPTLARGPGRFVAVVGPSGSGKSSLLRAGLLPRLARQPWRWVLLPPLLPGRQPMQALVGCLARGFAAAGDPRPAVELASVLDGGPAGLASLAEELADLNQDGVGRPSVLVVIDQAEELVTRSGPREQQAFLRLLGGALSEDSPLWAVATLRSEFLSTAPERAGLAEAIDDTLVVEPLSRARLAEVIARPARRAGLEFAPGLVERMVEDTVGGDALPLLAYTLQKLAEQARPDGRISAADYQGVGGVDAALQHQADRLVDNLTRRGHGPIIVPTLLKLATVDSEGDPTRRRMRYSALSGEEQVVVDAFVDARLLISGQSDQVEGETIVEVAHEALLRRWSPLRRAIEDSVVSLQMRAELDQEATDWERGNRDDAYLLRGGRLAAFEEWASQHPDDLGVLEDEFLQASRVSASQELEATQRFNRRVRRLVGGVATLLVIAVAAGGLAASQSQRAQAQASLTQIQERLALSRQLAVQANELVETRPDIAILVGLQSLSTAPDHSQQLPASLVAALHRLSRNPAYAGPTEAVRGARLSPDRKYLATFGAGHAVELWDVASGRLLHKFAVPADSYAVAFSPDDKFLANAGDDGRVRVWDVATGRLRAILVGHEDVVTDIAISRDGRFLASASADRTVRLWDTAVNLLLGPPLTGPIAPITGVAVSPDGRTLAAVDESGTVWLWKSATGQRRTPLHAMASYEISFTPNGSQLLADTDRRAWAWDLSREVRKTDQAETALGLIDKRSNTRSTAWIACKVVNHNLSAVDWQRFIPSLPYQRTCPELPAGKGAPTDAPTANYD
jgi:hypothetical protein